MASAAIAVDRPELTPQLFFRQNILTLIRPDVTWEQVRDKMREAFHRTDIDQTGISRATIEKHRLIQRAKQRAEIVTRKLAWDLDGDGTVTRDELVTVFRKDAEAQVRRVLPSPASPAEHDRLVGEKLEALIAPIMKDDADGDGRLTIAEMMAGADREIAEREARAAGPVRNAGPPMPEWMPVLLLNLVPPELDPDGDGVLTLEVPRPCGFRRDRHEP